MKKIMTQYGYISAEAVALDIKNSTNKYQISEEDKKYLLDTHIPKEGEMLIVKSNGIVLTRVATSTKKGGRVPNPKIKTIELSVDEVFSHCIGDHHSEFFRKDLFKEGRIHTVEKIANPFLWSDNGNISGIRTVAKYVPSEKLWEVLGITPSNILDKKISDLRNHHMMAKIEEVLPKPLKYLSMDEKSSPVTGNVIQVLTTMANGGSYYNGYFLVALTAPLMDYFKDMTIREALEEELTLKIDYWGEGGGSEKFYYNYKATAIYKGKEIKDIHSRN